MTQTLRTPAAVRRRCCVSLGKTAAGVNPVGASVSRPASPANENISGVISAVERRLEDVPLVDAVDADRQAAVQRRRVRGRRRRELALELEDDAVAVDALEQRMPCVLLEETPRERVEVDEENPLHALRQPRRAAASRRGSTR